MVFGALFIYYILLSDKVIKIELDAIDKINNEKYGTIVLTAPREAVTGLEKIDIIGMPYSKYQKFVDAYSKYPLLVLSVLTEIPDQWVWKLA